MSENGVKPATSPRLKVRYQDEIVPAMMKEFGYTNVMQVPRADENFRQYWLGRGAAEQQGD